MRGWLKSTIGEICDTGGGEVKTGPFGSQLHQSDYQDTGAPIVMPADIINGQIDQSRIARVSQSHVDRLHKHKLSKGDIIYGRRGDIGRQALVCNENIGWLCGTGCLRISLGNAPVIPEFLHLYLKMPEIIGWIYNQAIGATMPNLNTNILRRVPVWYPDSKNKQRKIASIVFAYGVLIENNKRRIALLEKMTEEIYREWFVRMRFPEHKRVKLVKNISVKWKYEKLGKLSSIIKRGVSPSYDDNSEMLVINQRCIRNGNINLSVARGHKTKIPKEKFLEYGDALINSTGVGTLGRISIVEYEPKELTVDSHVTICRANKAKINIHYLSHSVKRLQGYFEYMATGATGQVELNRKLISDTKIVVPDEELQRQFSDIISPIWRERSALTLAVNILSACKKLLLGRLISGKLPVESLDIQFPPSMQTEQDVAHA